MSLTSIWELLKETYNDWSEDKAPRLAAALAYYTVFALAPLLIIVIAIAGLVFGQEAAQGRIDDQLRGLIGEQGADAIQGMIVASSKPSTSIFASIIGIVTLLFGASGVFGQLQDALNTIWEVQPKPGLGIVATLKERFLSFSMVLGVGFLLLVSLVLSAGLAALGQFFGESVIWRVINFAVSFGVVTLLFAMIYKVLPDAKITWNDVWIGAAVTALLFTIGKLLIGLYLGRASTESSYGAAGSLIIVLLWVYYSAQILFLGAEFTQVYARKYGSRIVPDENAVALTEEARIQQGIPRNEDVEAAAEGMERQVGGPTRGNTSVEAQGRERQVGGPTRGNTSVEAQGRERQVGRPTRDSVEAHATRREAPAPDQPERRRSGALVGFMLGVLVGRRTKAGRAAKE